VDIQNISWHMIQSLYIKVCNCFVNFVNIHIMFHVTFDVILFTNELSTLYQHILISLNYHSLIKPILCSFSVVIV